MSHVTGVVFCVHTMSHVKTTTTDENKSHMIHREHKEYYNNHIIHRSQTEHYNSLMTHRNHTESYDSS
jgi:hypothetical protein